MQKTKNLIIGAGPAGLATAGRMRHANIPFEMIEKSQQVGNAWRHHYDRLHMHTVKRWSNLPHLPFPEAYPTYVSRQQLVDYMEAYAKHFDIRPKFGVDIISIKKSGTDWEAIAQNGDSYLAENIFVTTGLNRVPKIPQWQGQELFQGEIIHSRLYKNPKPFVGQKVLVVGIGNTGAEIALDLSEHGIDCHIVSRGELTLVPRDLNGRPVQETAKLLDKLPFGFGDWLGTQIRKIYFGNLSKYGLHISKEPPVKLLRETGKTPLIDIGTIAAIKAGKIKVHGDLDHFTASGVVFKNGEAHSFDTVLLATGYQPKIDELVEKGTDLLDPYGCPKRPVGQGFHQGLFFVGFDNYKLGGIFGTIATDSETVVQAVKEHSKTTT
jgi:NADPH-dependent glutamate synthase beta subunit-like oxidoreductase